MHELARRVATALRFDRLAGPGDRVLVALSGGPDSVAASLLLAEALPAVGAVPAGAAHLHHSLRGAEADRDEAFCRSFAKARRWPLIVERCDVAALAREHRISIEAAGHRARQAFYERAAQQAGATRVATGHTRNDLAETFLMRALRGAGLRGLAGIRPSRGIIIRPLLDVSRAEVLRYLTERAQPYCDDETNRDRQIRRNRVRNELLPWLEQHEGPRVVEALARAARLAASDEAYLHDAVRGVTGSTPWVVLPGGQGLSMATASLLDIPRPLQRRVMLEGLERVSGRTCSVTSVDRVLALLEAGGAGQASLSGVVARVECGTLALTPGPRGRRRPSDSARGVRELAPIPLQVPGEAELAGNGRLEATLLAHDEWPGSLPHRDGRAAAHAVEQAAFDLERCRLPLVVRFRRPGDRLQSLGMTGHKKLQDLLVDRKVPRAQRDGIPLVVDGDDQILWVPGHAVSESARVTPSTTSVLLLLYRR